jgi:hypothetical protein
MTGWEVGFTWKAPGRRGFRRYENGKIEANGLAWAASNARTAAKVKSWLYS